MKGDFAHSGICCKRSTTKHTQPRRFLQCVEDNFLTQVVEESTMRVVLLDLVLSALVGSVRGAHLRFAFSRCFFSKKTLLSKGKHGCRFVHGFHEGGEQVRFSTKAHLVSPLIAAAVPLEQWLEQAGAILLVAGSSFA